MTAPILRMVCAWCQKLVREGDEPTTHGICEACAEKVVAGKKTCRTL